MIKQRITSTLLMSGIIATCAYGQAEKGGNEDMSQKTYELNPVVITGTGTYQRLKNTPVPVSVITSEEIKRAGITDFQQAMTMMIPSLSFSPNAMGSYLTMNGLSNKYVLVLINGRKLIGDTANNIDLGRIDLSRVRRIEVLSGAASSLYGSDAIAGVINIITNDPKNEISLTSNSRYSGKGQYVQTLNLNLAKQKFASYTTFKHEQSDGWQNSNLVYSKNKVTGNLTTEESIYPLSIGFHSNMLDQKFTYAATNKLSFYAVGSYYWKLTDRPATNKNITGGSDYNLHYESFRYGAGARYKLNERNSFQIDFINDDYNQRYKYLVNNEKNGYIKDDYRFTKQQKYHDAELKSILGLTSNSSTVLGMNYRSDRLKSYSGNVNKTVYTLSAYAQHEMLLIDKLKAILGLRYDYHETAKGHLTPKASLMYSLGDFNLRATYATGFRAPGLDELYYHYYKASMGGKPVITIGNTNLRPERSNYYSVNTEYRTNKFSVSITGYLNYVNNMITKIYHNVDDEFRTWAQKEFELTDAQANKLINYQEYVNMDKATVKGFQADLSANPLSGFTLSGSYTYAYAQGRYERKWQNINRSIRHSGTLAGNYKHTWINYTLNINLSGRLQSKVYYPGDDYGNAPGYGIWNLSTRHSFDCFRHFFFEPSIGIDNLFNQKDHRPKGVNYANYSPGRMVFVGLTLKIK